MIDEIFDRTKRLIGGDGLARLMGARVLVFGLGGVGSYVCEGLARAGVGTLGIVDRDVVAVSNINRQIIALCSTVGMKKTEATAARLSDINPQLKIEKYFLSYDEKSADAIDFSRFDFVVDAIDSLPSKVLIAKKAQAANVPLISSMGTGFRIDPARLKICDIFSTQGCPLARLMRKELRKNGIDRLKVLFSDEPSCAMQSDSTTLENLSQNNLLDLVQTKVLSQNNLNNIDRSAEHGSKKMDKLPEKTDENRNETEIESKNITPKTIASISFVPSVAGLLIAGEVVRSLLTI